MKTYRLIPLVLYSIFVVVGCTLVEGALVSLDFNIDGVYDIVPNQTGTWNGNTNPISIDELLSDHNPEKVSNFRVYDIIVRVLGPYPSGQVSGTVEFSFDGQTFTPILSFEGLYSEFAEGVSLVRRNNIVSSYPAGIQAFLNAMNSPGGRPASIILRTSGTTVTPVPAGVVIGVEIRAQADTEVF